MSHKLMCSSFIKGVTQSMYLIIIVFILFYPLISIGVIFSAPQTLSLSLFSYNHKY